MDPDPTLLAAVGRRIRHARKARRLSQMEVAAAVEIRPGSLSNYETGQRRIHIDTLARLAKELGVPIVELVDTRAAPPRPRPGPALNAEEASLVKRWRELTPGDRELLLDFVRMLRSRRRRKLG